MLAYNSEIDCEAYPTTIPEVLSQAGYKSYVSGKDHFGTHDDGTPVTHGYEHLSLYDGLTEENDDYDQFFDAKMPGENPKATCDLDWNMWAACPYVYDESLHPTAWTTDTAIDYMDAFFSNSNSADSSMFLKLSYHRPHSPYDPPARLFDRFLNDSSLVPDRFVNNTSWDSAYFQNFTTDPEEMNKSAWNGDPGEEAARHTRAGYLASIAFVDEGVGRVLEYLENNNLRDDFFILWAADHGDMNGDHNLWRKGYPWEASARVPFVISPDKNTRATAPGTVSKGVVEMRDIAPTLFDVAGVLGEVQAADPMMNGASLLGLLSGEEETVRDFVDMEHGQLYDEKVHWSGLVDAEMKFIFNAFDASMQVRSGGGGVGLGDFMMAAFL